MAPLFSPALLKMPVHTFDFTERNIQVEGMVQKGGQCFQDFIDADLREHQASWGIGRYLEPRRGVLKGTYIDQQQRYYHLGLDLALPVKTSIFAPLSGEIYQSGYASEWGDYGYYCSTYQEFEGIPFYLFFGHLKKGSFKTSGPISAGQEIGVLGDFDDNGQWFHHTHVQVCLLPWREGTTPDGYCHESMIDQYRLLNPNPLYLLKEFVKSCLPVL